jgi:hypothetical protein
MKSPIPRGLLGIMIPDSGKWLVRFEYSELGHVKAVKDPQLDAEAVLKKYQEHLTAQNFERARRGLATFEKVAWEVAPEFDPDRMALEWALRAETSVDGFVQHTARMFGRRGYLDLVAIRSTQSAEAAPIGDLLDRISFEEGEGYADSIRGDDMCNLSMTELILHDGSKVEAKGLFSRPSFWAGAVLAVVMAVSGAAILVVRRVRRQMASQRTYVSGNGAVNGFWRLLFCGNGHSRGKRTFNYTKFYSDLMSQVSYGSYGAMPMVNGSKRINGESAPHEPPRWQSAPTAPPAPTQMALFNSTDLVSELISNQKALIEEQKRLLQQQTRLIEEKSRVIEEKSRMLEQQTELIENNVL